MENDYALKSNNIKIHSCVETNMLNMIYNKLKKFASWKTLLLFLGLFIIFTVILFSQPFGIAYINEISGGAGIIDTRFTYSPENAYQILEAQGEKGREAYLFLNLIDLVYPIIYSLFCAITITVLFKRLFTPTHPFQKLSLLPWSK